MLEGPDRGTTDTTGRRRLASSGNRVRAVNAAILPAGDAQACAARAGG
jgi:hypothetical protein